MPHKMILQCFVLVAVFAAESLHAATARAELDWKPDRTWIFAVGVLEWQHPDVWPGFPDAQTNRRDAQLVQHFQRSGVTNDRIVYLQDKNATRDRIQHELTTQLARTGPGDLLVFYFAGHGFRDHRNHEVHFANYDAIDGKTAWQVKSIFETVEARFRGATVVLMADCCYSGGLMDEVRTRKTHLGYSCLCSSSSHNTSTGHWTFTDSLLAGLRGDPLSDLNEDGEIEMNELGQYTELEMAFIERQKAVFANNGRFPERWRVAQPARRRAMRQGERIEVEWKGKWYRAQILESSGDRCRIHYVGFEDSWDEWVGPERMRGYQPKHLDIGTAVEVLWKQDKKWYPAKVMRTWYGLTLIHYDDFGTEWDEWVNVDAIRLPSKGER